MNAANPSEHLMQCMEVWGGNNIVDSGVVMAGLDAWVFSKPFGAADAGGDIYYVSSCATGRITRLLVADVSGHGSHVSDIATSLRALMRKHVNQIEQTRFVRSMNEQFAAMSKAGVFATAIVTTFFAPTHELKLCNAGHPPPLLYRARTRSWSFLECGAKSQAEVANVPLGVIDLADYDQFDVLLKVGDLVLCYTDSLIESKDETGEMLGTAGLLRIAQSIAVDDPAQVVPRLLDTITRVAPGNLNEDDVTVLLFRPNGLAPRASLGQRLLSPLRVAAKLFSSEPVPWPEWNIKNLGGTMSLALSRWRSRVTSGSGDPSNAD